MSFWPDAPEPPESPPVGPLGWLRVILKGGVLGLVVFGGLAVHLLVRLIEWPIFGLNRPVTPHITRAVSRAAVAILGLRFAMRGLPMKHHGALVANHASWLDIFTLNACDTFYFVAKAEVAGWAFIGWLARATGTVFIKRDGREAAKQKALFEARLDAGHRLLFFPEGTSTDSLRVLPFKPTLFAAFFSKHLKETCWIQPVTVIYTAPAGQDPSFYGWWGDMTFAQHLVKVLAAPRQGSVEVVFHEPLSVASFVDRKHLAQVAEEQVRSAAPRA